MPPLRPHAERTAPAAARFAHDLRLPLLVLLLCLLATLARVHQIRELVDADKQRIFADQANDLRQEISARLRAHELMLLAGVALFDASGAVERSDFKRYSDHLLSSRYAAGLRGLGYALGVPKAPWATPIAAVQQQGFAGDAVRPAGERVVLAPMALLKPFRALNLRAFGFDRCSQATCRSAMDLAGDSSLTTLSGKVLLVQDGSDAAQPGVLMYSPVYPKQSALDTVAPRRAAPP